MERQLKKWIESELLEDFMIEEINSLNEKELQKLFEGNLDFGTGGMRGVIGPGPNRINRLTIGRAAAGFGDYLLQKKEGEKIVIIAYDNRLLSKELAMTTAAILSAKGIHVKLFTEVTSTPILSYSVREYQATGGVMITASHNPKEFNGFKIYDSSGCQLLIEEAECVKKLIEKYQDVFQLDKTDDHVTRIGDEIEGGYLQEFNGIFTKHDKSIQIGYSPQHGAGGRIMKKAFQYYGFSNVQYVTEQYDEDPNFSHTVSPNPEDPKAFEYLLKYGEKYNLDLLLTTDPDADRIGVYCLGKHGYERLTGNQLGAIMCNFLIENDSDHIGKYLVTTIVSSPLGKKIAQKNKVDTIEVLTGFKYIGDIINSKGADNFLFAYEESFGFLFNPITRDKDGIQSGLLIAEIANKLQFEGKTLISYLQEIYDKYGFFVEETLSISDEGTMALFYKNYTKFISYFESKATKIEDYKKGISRDNENNITKLTYPKDDVQKLYFANESWLCVRPSGTENKVKIYFGSSNMEKNIAIEAFNRLKSEIVYFVTNGVNIK